MYLIESKIEKKLVWSKILFVWGWISSLFWTFGFFYSMFSKSGLDRKSRDPEIYIFVLVFFGIFALLGYIKLIFSIWLRNMTKKARFINSFFENDLDGSIEAKELSIVLGENSIKAGKDLKRLRTMFMTGFDIVQSNDGIRVLLDSKKVKCCCKSCGGEIDKKIYFTGTCPYCGSLDIFAQVISQDKIYSIQHIDNKSAERQSVMSNISHGDSSNEYFYITGDTDDANKTKELIRMLIFGFLAFMMLVCILLSTVDVFRGDREISVPISFVLIIMPFIYNCIKHYHNYIYISSAKRFSTIAAKADTPFIKPEIIFVENLMNMINQYSTLKRQFSTNRKISVYREMQKRGYIRHCSLIYNGSEFEIGLSREIKRDVCPMCGAAITGTLKDNTACKYCGYTIEDAVAKL